MIKRRVLIVDDNFDLAENLAEILVYEGYEVTAFDGAEPALEHARRAAFDVALLDVKMPGIDGVDLHKALRRTHPDASYVLMTAFSADARVREALDAGVTCVLPKPVPVDDLVDALGAADCGHVHVLLVEDDPELAASLAEALSERGYIVRRAATCREAERDAASGGIEAAVVDVRLPDGDGAGLARDLVAKDVRVVLVTGLSPEELRARLGDPGDVGAPMLTKPFPTEELLTLLRDRVGVSTSP